MAKSKNLCYNLSKAKITSSAYNLDLMKANTHPTWYPEAKVTCGCGHIFTVGSTKPEIQVEICSACHPFFTGSMKYVDTAGRVEKFQDKQNAIVGKTWIKKKDRELFKKLQEEREEKARPKSFKEMLHRKENEEDKEK